MHKTIGGRPAASFHPALLDGIRAFAHSGGIDQPYRNSADHKISLDRIAGRPRNLRDDRAIPSDPAVEQA